MEKYLTMSMMLFFLVGCEHVKPLDRNFLSKEQMGGDPYPFITAMQQHTYFSREGVEMGSGVGGTSCGCN